MAAERKAPKAAAAKGTRAGQATATAGPADDETAMTVAELGAAIAALEGLPDVERARQAGLLFDVAQRLLPRVRQAALYAATREYGSRLRVRRS